MKKVKAPALEPEPKEEPTPELVKKVEETVMRKLAAKFDKLKESVSIGGASRKELGPRAPIKKDSHIGRLENLKIFKGKIPVKIVARLTGLSQSKTFPLHRPSGLNNRYIASTNNKFTVTDKNDICFFIIKAIKNPELYEILEPKGLLK